MFFSFFQNFRIILFTCCLMNGQETKSLFLNSCWPSLFRVHIIFGHLCFLCSYILDSQCPILSFSIYQIQYLFLVLFCPFFKVFLFPLYMLVFIWILKWYCKGQRSNCFICFVECILFPLDLIFFPALAVQFPCRVQCMCKDNVIWRCALTLYIMYIFAQCVHIK